MKAVILAGGLGERLRPFTSVIPKPLMPLNGVSLIERQITNLAEFGATDIYICTYYMAEFVERFLRSKPYNTNIHVSEEKKPLGTAGPLSLLRDDLKEPFLVLNGDILTNLDLKLFYDYGLRSGAEFCAAVREQVVPYDFGVIECHGNEIINIREKPETKNIILTGIYFLRPEILELVPNETYFGIDNLLNLALNSGVRVCKYDFTDYWLDIGRYDQIEDADIAAKKLDGR